MIRPMRMLLVLPLLTGCAARAAYFVMDAEKKYKAAEEIGAEERAVYEMTLAEQYLWKAKEEINDSDYGSAEQLLKKSSAWSLEAYEKSEDRGADVKNADEFVPEVKPDKPVDPKDETRIDIDLDDL